MTRPRECTAEWIFRRYEQVRDRLPKAQFPQECKACGNLSELTDVFDAFLFDSFGVLNVGEQPIAGARERIRQLRADGKRVIVLTNAATGPLAGLVAKYANLGFDFTRLEIVSSRDVLQTSLASYSRDMTWGIAAPEVARVEELDVSSVRLALDDQSFAQADGFVFLSTQAWSDDLQAALLKAMHERPRPLLVGNPDLAAPREDGFSIEPGSYAHAIADLTGTEPEFFGKPFANAFTEAVARLGEDIPRHRIAMVGDTLHTDILGGAAAGLGTVLVTDHGVLKDLDLAVCLATSKIMPDYVVASI